VLARLLRRVTLAVLRELFAVAAILKGGQKGQLTPTFHSAGSGKKVPWTEHKTNEEILQMVETEREIMDSVRSRQKRWLGHILRQGSLLRITLEGQIQGKKVYGRPRTMLLDWLLKTEESNISYEERKMSAQYGSRWSQ